MTLSHLQVYSYCKPFKCDFYARRYASPVFAIIASPSVPHKSVYY